jgi:uncharacterized protein (UPF0332 family)
MSKLITAAAYMEKAERVLPSARLLLTTGDSEGACNRAYYAMHDAAHAALIATGHETPDALIKTHDTLIGEFSKRLVLGGLIESRFGRAFNKIEDIRLLADYSTDPPPLDDAKWAVEQAEAFVAAIHSMILRLPPKP